MRPKLALTRETRAIAIAAAAKGYVSPKAIWDLACRWTLGGAQSAHELFEDFLTKEQLAEITATLEIGPSIPPERPEVRPSISDEPSGIRQVVNSERPPASSRYELGDLLGMGGVGKVVTAADRELGRNVALKTMRSEVKETAGERFLSEARLTAQLEHPNIVPVYDMGRLPDGQPFYTMRVVKRQSLQDVLASKELRKQWPLVRLVGAFVQVSRALAYAHQRGVLHRDIKPENILLGDFGEVYLADWGNAKATGLSMESGRPVLGQATPPTFIGSEGGRNAPSGLQGTPGYISPEQIRGDLTKINQRADVFALGVVLYEMLTGEHPFDAPSVLAVILATQTRAPKPPRQIVPSCPLVLEDLCLQMLEKDPDKRPASADRCAQEAEAFLEGARERARRREEALRLAGAAAVPVEKSKMLAVERARLVEEARRVLKDVKGHEPIEKKKPGWQLEDRAAAVERAEASASAEAIELYTKALGYDPDLADARAGLADLYWTRASGAAEEHRAAEQVYYEALVSEFDVGKYAALLRADSVISIETSVPGATVLAYRYVEQNRVLVASEEQCIGITPLTNARLRPGSYLIVLQREGFRDVRYPVSLARGAHHEARINLYTDAEIGEDFVYVPGGTFLAGGDPEAVDSLPRARPDVGDFAIARHPVTYRAYCAFLDEIQKHDPDLAIERSPHDLRGSDGSLARIGSDGRWEPLPSLIEGDACRMFPAEEGHLWKVPVMLVDWFDASAFCRWMSDVHGFEVRLPTELKWEKAARGADGRALPWGDHFDPTFCHMRESRAFIPQPEPIGTFAFDVSPYGVSDMAGGMREWMADVYGERSAAEVDADEEPPSSLERGSSPVRVIRSGNWVANAEYCRAASRSRFPSLTRGTGLGFRVARSLKR